MTSGISAMNSSGLLLLLGMLGVTALAGMAVAQRLGFRHSSERLLAAAVLGHLLILAPVYALGALSALTSASAALGTLAVDAVALVIVGRGHSIAQVVAEVAQASRQLGVDLARLIAPVPGRVHMTGYLLLGVAGLIVWLTLTCYFAPSFRAYDAPWYHEPIIAFAVQERGLHVPMLPDRLFYVASLPRGSELMSAWLVLVGGSRALIELPSVVGFAALWLGTYRLARVLGGWKHRALGWATVVVLTPGLLAYAQSTYVDLHACAMLTAAACFAVARPAPGRALLAVVAACLAVSMKLYALGPGAFLAGIALLRAYCAQGVIAFRWWAAAALVPAAAGVALATPLRNMFVFGNPLYPVSVTVPFVQHVLPGPIDMRARDQEITPWWELLRLIFQPPTTYQTDFTHYVEVHLPIEVAPAFNYGYAMPTVGLGLALVGLAQFLWAPARTTMGVTGPTQLRRTGFALARLAPAAIVVLAVAAFFFVFPIARLARYLGFVFACTGALAATALMNGRARSAGDGLLILALFLQLLLVSTQSPRLLYSPAEIWQLAHMAPPERELSRAHGAFASSDAARFRDQALAQGTLVLFGDDVLEPGPLWNRSMSSRVEYLPPGDSDPTEAADKRGATLLACTRGSPRCAAVEQRSDAWALIGRLYPKIISQECLVFRRIAGEPRLGNGTSSGAD